MSFSVFKINIASLNKSITDLNNLCSIIKLQIQIIRICEHKVKRGSCLNGLQPGYTFEFGQTISTHGGVAFCGNDIVCYRVRKFVTRSPGTTRTHKIFESSSSFHVE